MTVLLSGRPGLAMAANDTHYCTVRWQSGGPSHYPGRIIGDRVIALCGLDMGLSIIWSSVTVADCSRCRAKAHGEIQ